MERLKEELKKRGVKKAYGLKGELQQRLREALMQAGAMPFAEEESDEEEETEEEEDL